MAALTVLLRTNMDAKFVNVQVSVFPYLPEKIAAKGSSHAQKEDLRDKRLKDELRTFVSSLNNGGIGLYWNWSSGYQYLFSSS